MGITIPLTLIPGNIVAPIKEELPISFSTPEGSTVPADAEFDVVENYRNAKAVYVDLQVTQRKGDAHKSIIGKGIN